MEENLEPGFKFTKKKVISLVVIIFLLAAIPLGVYLAQKTQIFKSRASEIRQMMLEDNPVILRQKFVPGEILVKFKQPLDIQSKKSSASTIDIDQQTASYSAIEESSLPKVLINLNKQNQIQNISKVFKDTELQKKNQSSKESLTTKGDFSNDHLSRIYKITLPQNASVEQIIKDLSNNPEVEYAMVNFMGKADFVANDTYFQYMWNLKKIQIQAAWDMTQGSNAIIVAVLDSGVNTSHTDMTRNIKQGRNFVDKNDYTQDLYGHGTRVASIISAITNNSLGISGIAWNSQLMPVKVIDDGGIALADDVAQGIIYAADNGATIINMSLGFQHPCSEDKIIQDAINYARQKNIVIVTSAGNDNIDVANKTPASCDQVITVAATDQMDLRAPYSNYGKGVDISAPGGGGCQYNLIDCYLATLSLGNQITWGYGTSFAAPQVSAAISLFLSKKSDLSLEEIKNNLKVGGDILYWEDPAKPVNKRLNVYKSLQLLVDTPTPTPTPQKVCAQVITYAKNPATNECKTFPTPCDVPTGWTTVPSCPRLTKPTPTPTPTTKPVQSTQSFSCNACSADLVGKKDNKGNNIPDGWVTGWDFSQGTGCRGKKAGDKIWSTCQKMDINGNGAIDNSDWSTFLGCIPKVYNKQCQK